MVTLADLTTGLHTVYQPIVDLRVGHSLVAVEALTRGAPGPLEPPARLFAAAAGAGLVRELDEACLRAALLGAPAGPGAVTLFVNVEPVTLAALTSPQLHELVALVPPSVRVVLEVTERDLMVDPAGLVAAVGGLRELGWGIALDDVGAEPAGVALLPFLRPDIIKLDLALVRGRTTMQLAAIVNAVRAEAERSGAVLLAEGIETEEHLERALAMGARLGQGWLFGHPGPMPSGVMQALRLADRPAVRTSSARTPYAVLAEHVAPQLSTVPLLEAMTHQLEHQALMLDDQTVVLANFEDAGLLSRPTRRRYAALATATAMTVMVGPGLSREPVPGVRGASVADDDDLTREWVVVVVAPHFAAAMAAREVQPAGGVPPARADVRLGEQPPGEPPRQLEHVLTYDRDVVVRAAHLLLRKVAPLTTPADGVPAGLPAVPRVAPAVLPRLLNRAVTGSSISIALADARLPDLPLVYVNDAFLRLTGFSEDEVLGRNCRFLQGPGTDATTTRVLRRHLDAGRPWHGALLNYRSDGSTFWNELQISPVRDGAGVLTHHLSAQLDVTARLEREDRTSYLAYNDALTGLSSRARILDHLADEVRRARHESTGVAVVVADLDGFKAVNDRFGHAGGDTVLRAAGHRLRGAVPPGGLVGRLGGDEFLIVLSGLPELPEMSELSELSPHAGALPWQRQVAAGVLAGLRSALERPVTVGGDQVRVRASLGVALYPHDAVDDHALIAHADAAMYRDKALG